MLVSKARAGWWSWLDVEAFLRDEKLIAGDWPPFIASVIVVPDGLYINCEEGRYDESLFYFSQLFEPRVQNQSVVLEPIDGNLRYLPIVVEEIARQSFPAQLELFKPQFSSVRFLFQYQQNELHPLDVPVVAFYSFKGGVGRTTHLIAALREFSGISSKKALIVDADLEAPGITWLAQADGFDTTPFAFVDFLALLHSEPTATAVDAAVSELRKNPLRVSANNLEQEYYFLPAFRNAQQSLGPYITPADLLNGNADRWPLTDSLVEVARRLEVGCIFLDLRAGISELASPMLFDPRITKCIVTTLGIQSLVGTRQILDEVLKVTGAAQEPPFILISQNTREFSSELDIAVSDFESILEEGDLDLGDASRVIDTPFSSQLMHASSLRNMIDALDGTEIARKLEPLLSSVSLQSGKFGANISTLEDLDSRRLQLERFAKACEFAEAGESASFLSTPQLRALSQRYFSTLPVLPVIGNKGAGKTFTFLQILRNKTWASFVAETLGTPEAPVDTDAVVVPFTVPTNIERRAKEYVHEAQEYGRTHLGLRGDLTPTAIRDRIRGMQKGVQNESDCRREWFRLFAELFEIDVSEQNPDSSFIEGLRSRGKRCVLLLDGLEDLFDKVHAGVGPEAEAGQRQALVLRSLLTEVIPYLQDVPNSPIGLIAFVRSDYIQSVILQNSAQYERRFDHFALRWNDEQALRLALWIATKSGSLAAPGKAIVDLTRAELVLELEGFWGRYLGTAKSRKAITESWVTAVLSDYRGRIQARDLARLLRHSAGRSIGSRVQDRVLAPEALRSSVAQCAREKVIELGQESPDLEVFFRTVENSGLYLPLSDSELSGGLSLSVPSINTLVETGVLLQYEGSYYMPEIIRQGLGLRFKSGYRAKVMILARRAAALRRA